MLLVLLPACVLVIAGPVLAGAGPPLSRTLGGPYRVLPGRCADILSGGEAARLTRAAGRPWTGAAPTAGRIRCAWWSATAGHRLAIRIELRRYGPRRWIRGTTAAHRDFVRRGAYLDGIAVVTPRFGDETAAATTATPPAGAAAVTGAAAPHRPPHRSVTLLLRAGNVLAQVTVDTADTEPDPAIIRARAVATQVLASLEAIR